MLASCIRMSVRWRLRDNQGPTEGLLLEVMKDGSWFATNLKNGKTGRGNSPHAALGALRALLHAQLGGDDLPIGA